MNLDILVVLTLFLLIFFSFIMFFIFHYFFYLTLINKIEKFINRINQINSKKINFKIKNAYIYAKNNKLYTNLIASWTITSKEMRMSTSLASIHVKQAMLLVEQGNLIKARNYMKVLNESTKILKHQWKVLDNDVESFIQFASQPNSILIDLKQIYAEVITLCNHVIGDRETKTKIILDNSSKIIERLFTKFEEVSTKGNYDHAYKIIVEIKNELQNLSDTLNGVPYIAYLVSNVFRKERHKFKGIYKLIKRDSIFLNEIHALRRYKKVVEKVSSYNEAFLSRFATMNEVSHIIIDEIIRLSKLNIILKGEINCKENYFKWKLKVLPWVNQLFQTWEIIEFQQFFKYYDEAILSSILSERDLLSQLMQKDETMNNSDNVPLYIYLLNNLIDIVSQATIFDETLKVNVNQALEFEKTRELLKNNLINSYSKVNKFWKDNLSIPYEHIHAYFSEQIAKVKKKHIKILKATEETNYKNFDILEVTVEKMIDNMEKLEWEVDTLIANENHIRKLYEITNRYRSENPQIKFELDIAEKLIYEHNIKVAYQIISKILKKYDRKILKKYKIIIS